MRANFAATTERCHDELSLQPNIARVELEAQSILVDRFKETRPQVFVNHNCGGDYFAAEVLVFEHPRPTLSCLHGFLSDLPVRFWVENWRGVGRAVEAAGHGDTGAPRRAGRPPKNDRNFLEAVMWWRRTGVPWRDLPESFGPWKTVFNRFDR